TPGAAASDDPRSVAQLRQATRCPSRLTLWSPFLRRRARWPLAAPVCPSGLLASVPRDRSSPPGRSLRPTCASPPASLRRSNAPHLAPRGYGCRTAASCPFHLSWPRLCARHLLVSLGLPGLDGSRGATPRSAVDGNAMKPGSNVAALIE